MTVDYMHQEINFPLFVVVLLLPPQAYTSQFVALIMFALLISDDRISMQARRREIIQGLKVLPGKSLPVGPILIREETTRHRHGKLTCSVSQIVLEVEAE